MLFLCMAAEDEDVYLRSKKIDLPQTKEATGTASALIKVLP